MPSWTYASLLQTTTQPPLSAGLMTISSRAFNLQKPSIDQSVVRLERVMGVVKLILEISLPHLLIYRSSALILPERGVHVDVVLGKTMPIRSAEVKLSSEGWASLSVESSGANWKWALRRSLRKNVSVSCSVWKRSMVFLRQL